MSDNGDRLVIVGVVLAVLLTGFICADALSGELHSAPGVITSHVYKPARTDVEIHTDGNGHTWTSNDYVPERYELCGRCEEMSRCWAVGKEEYARVRDGDRVEITWRVGRWTGWRY